MRSLSLAFKTPLQQFLQRFLVQSKTTNQYQIKFIFLTIWASPLQFPFPSLSSVSEWQVEGPTSKASQSHVLLGCARLTVSSEWQTTSTMYSSLQNEEQTPSYDTNCDVPCQSPHLNWKKVFYPPLILVYLSNRSRHIFSMWVEKGKFIKPKKPQEKIVPRAEKMNSYGDHT